MLEKNPELEKSALFQHKCRNVKDSQYSKIGAAVVGFKITVLYSIIRQFVF